MVETKKQRKKAVRYMTLNELIDRTDPFEGVLRGVVRYESPIQERLVAYSMVVTRCIMTGQTMTPKVSDDAVKVKYDLPIRKVGDELLKEYISAAFETPMNRIQRSDKEFLSRFMMKRSLGGFNAISGLTVGEVMWYISCLLSKKFGGTTRFWWEFFYNNCDIRRYGKQSNRELMNRIAENELLTGRGFGIFGLRRDGEMVHKPGFEQQLSIFFTKMETRVYEKAENRHRKD